MTVNPMPSIKLINTKASNRDLEVHPVYHEVKHIGIAKLYRTFIDCFESRKHENPLDPSVVC